MKRDGIHKPTIEDCVELSGIETLHPGGFALTKRTAEVAGLKPGMKVLDVSSGRGTQSIFYAKEFGVNVTGVDLSDEMIETANKNTRDSGMETMIEFLKGDSQALPFNDSMFDSVINECAVGIPDDSQKVLNEMVRVLKPGGTIVIHESTWITILKEEEKYDISERYGTTPLEHKEWISLLERAGARSIETELEKWSKPEMFWKVRKDRDVKNPSKVLTIMEKVPLFFRIIMNYGFSGIFKAFENEKVFYNSILNGKLGYCLYWGVK